jgi:hypothetical protein
MLQGGVILGLVASALAMREVDITFTGKTTLGGMFWIGVTCVDTE